MLVSRLKANCKYLIINHCTNPISDLFQQLLPSVRPLRCWHGLLMLPCVMEFCPLWFWHPDSHLPAAAPPWWSSVHTVLPDEVEMFPAVTGHKTCRSNRWQHETFLLTLKLPNPGVKPPLQNHFPLQSQGEMLLGLLQNMNRGGKFVIAFFLLLLFFSVFLTSNILRGLTPFLMLVNRDL